VAAAAAGAPAGSKLFVNLHPEELDDFELLSSSAPLSTIARSVVLELTERTALDSVKGLHARVAKLRKLGFTIGLDDLGSGHAGLASFAQLEPDIVKIDMSLVRGVDASARKRSVVRAMLQLAGRDLNMMVICEGVETAAERDALASVGGDLFQGYLFGAPGREFAAPRWG